MKGTCRLAADIGGTFTDVVLDTPSGRHTAKVLTTARAPESGVFEALDRVLEQGATAAPDVDVFVHGTTLATNALIERKGARTAFLTTRGFRDILEMGFEKRFEQYDIFMDKPEPLVPRPLRREIDERVSARGRVLVPLDTARVRDIAAEWKPAGIEAVAVGLLHAYAHPAHERAIRELLSAELPDATVCLSSEVCPEIREYERFSTTCANAYVRPLMSGYLLRLREGLRARGMTCPFYLMMSGGGVTTVEIAARFPVRLIESGPAGGAILAGHVARQCGLEEALSLDMGGTTAKICLIENGTPERSRTFEVARRYRDLKGSGLPVRVPVIEMVEIGAGGGSIAAVDAMSRLRVGPASAGSEPGPACYGRGGRRATVTDANLVLGKLDPERFAGGRIGLDPERATVALARDVGGPLGLEDHWPAVGVVEVVDENMANAARVHAIERGKVIGRHTMVAFGGGAPLHAGRLARKLGIDRVVIPTGAGVGSAIGFLLAPIAYEVVRTLQVDFRDFDAGAINTMLDEMQAQATNVVRGGASARLAACRHPGRRAAVRRTRPRPSHRARRRAARPGPRFGAEGPVRSPLSGRLRAHHRRPRHPERLLVGHRLDRGSAGRARIGAGAPAPDIRARVEAGAPLRAFLERPPEPAHLRRGARESPELPRVHPLRARARDGDRGPRGHRRGRDVDVRPCRLQRRAQFLRVHRHGTQHGKSRLVTTPSEAPIEPSVLGLGPWIPGCVERPVNSCLSWVSQVT